LIHELKKAISSLEITVLADIIERHLEWVGVATTLLAFELKHTASKVCPAIVGDTSAEIFHLDESIDDTIRPVVRDEE
jgi:hypothetical protein